MNLKDFETAFQVVARLRNHVIILEVLRYSRGFYNAIKHIC